MPLGGRTSKMNGAMKAILDVLIARPLIAIAIAAVVVGVAFLFLHRQKTPVTHRVQHVELTDRQQMQLGSQEYAKTLRENRARIVRSGPEYVRVQRLPHASCFSASRSAEAAGARGVLPLTPRPPSAA